MTYTRLEEIRRDLAFCAADTSVVLEWDGSEKPEHKHTTYVRELLAYVDELRGEVGRLRTSVERLQDVIIAYQEQP